MEIDLWVKPPVLPLYGEGKDLEVRAKTGLLETICVGDILNINQALRRKVVAIRNYRDFEEMLSKEDHRRIGPGYDEQFVLSRLREIYHTRLEKKGVIVFELQVISTP